LTSRAGRTTVSSSKLVSKYSTMQYTVVIEKGPTSFGAYVPDLPGCIAAAETRAEVVILIREAIEFHLEGLREDGMAIPAPCSSVESVEIAAA
jgi:predicted RNase H-like HicB family nuclease